MADDMPPFSIHDRIERLIARLRDPRPLVRRFGAIAFSELHAEPAARAAIPALRSILNDPDVSVRIKVAEALALFGDSMPTAIDTLARAIGDKDAFHFDDATHALAYIGPAAASARPALITALGHPWHIIRITAIDAMVATGVADDAAAQALINALRTSFDDDQELLMAARHALVVMGLHAVPALVGALRDPRLHVRELARDALGQIRSIPADLTSGLVESLQDEIWLAPRPSDWPFSLVAGDPLVEALCWVEGSTASLAPFLQNADAAIRRAVVRALFWKPADVAALPWLLAATRDEDADVRYGAISVLVPLLRSESDVRTPVVAALIERLVDQSGTVRKQAISELASVKAAEAVPHLRSLLDAADLRVEAALAVWRITGDEGPLLTMLRDTLEAAVDHALALRIVSALGRAALAAVSESQIRRLLSDADAATRRNWSRELARIAPEIPAHQQMVSDTDASVRAATATGLSVSAFIMRRHNDMAGLEALAKSVGPCLLTAIRDEDEDVRFIAARGLWWLEHRAGAIVGPLLDLRGEALYESGFDPVRQCVPIGSLRVHWPRSVKLLSEIATEDASALPELANCANGHRTIAALNACRVLCKAAQHPDVIAPRVAAFISDKSRLIVIAGMEAAAALGASGSACVSALIRRLMGGYWLYRWYAAEGLGQIGPEARRATPVLVRALDDPAPQVRKAAAEALGQIDPDVVHAAPALLKVIENDYARTRLVRTVIRNPESLARVLDALRLRFPQDG